METPTKYKKERKIAVMGHRAVGKSSLSFQYVDGLFENTYHPTIQDTLLKTICVNNELYDIEIVDTAGQDEYSILPCQYAMDVHGYILVYSITSPRSFEIAKVIYDKLLDFKGKVRVPVVLVGNKKDLDADRCVTVQEGIDLANSWKAVFLEASAKENQVASKNTLTDIFKSIILQIEKINGNYPDRSVCSIS